MRLISLPHRIVLAACTLALLGCGDSPLERVSPLGESNEARLRRLENDTEAVENLIETFNTAFDARDGRRLVSLFAPSSDVYLYDGRVIKADKLDREMESLWSTWTGIQTTWHVKGVNIRAPFAWAKYTEEIAYQTGGVTRTMNNLVTLGLERKDGTWYITHLHLSSATPPDA